MKTNSPQETQHPQKGNYTSITRYLCMPLNV